MKILVATEKPFAQIAIDGIKKEAEGAGHEVVLLEKYTEKQQLLDAVANADAMIVRSDKITADVLDAAKNMKVIVRAGAGFDSIDTAYAKEKGIIVENTPGQNANAVAELVISLFVYGVRNMYNGKSGSELMGKNLGILAYGNVGRNVARIAKGFGMNIYAYDAFCPASVMEADGVKCVASSEELFKTCQYVSLHIPATKETINSINYDLVNLMPKNGMVVNSARKEIIDEAGLLKLMQERTDLKYISDIRPDESIENELLKLEGRYFATPKKMGAQTSEANINAGIAAAKQINAYFKDGCTKFQVNK